MVTEQQYVDAVFLVEYRNRKCRQIIRDLAEDYNLIRGGAPKVGILELREYVENRIFSIELLLKVMTGDWDGPGPTRSGHDVKKMFEEVMPAGVPREVPFSTQLLVGQKFSLIPLDNIQNEIVGLEKFWAQILLEFNGNPKYAAYRRRTASAVAIEANETFRKAFGFPDSVVPQFKKTLSFGAAIYAGTQGISFFACVCLSLLSL